MSFGTIPLSLDDKPDGFVLLSMYEKLESENAKLRELLQKLLIEYRYMRVRPRAVYLQHEGRMRAIEEEMRELGIEVES